MDHRIEWPSRQMYSRKRPIGRDQIVAGFSRVLGALTGKEVAPPEKLAEEKLSDCEQLGYWAAKLTYRLRTVGDGQEMLSLVIDPIPGSMGVSGEHLTFRGENLAAGVALSGAARSHAILPSFAELRVLGVSETQAHELSRQFQTAFPKIMSAEELSKELDRKK